MDEESLVANDLLEPTVLPGGGTLIMFLLSHLLEFRINTLLV
jgi:hypothetical protein